MHSDMVRVDLTYSEVLCISWEICQGKCFYIELEGPGRMPVLHFGMTGMLKVYFPCTFRSGAQHLCY